KDRVLEIYLNEIYLGANSYGVTAAAQSYFNKTLSQLTPSEAAFLGGLPKEPGRLNPGTDKARATDRRNYVLQQMYQNHYLTKAQYDQALADPLKSVQGGDFPAFSQALPPRSYFTDEIRRQLSQTFGQQEFFGGGLTVRATIDPDMQKIAAQAMRDGLENYDRAQGVWRGTGKTLPLADLKTEAKWRKALSDERVPRDIPGWYPAVVLGLSAHEARIGIEGHPLAATDVIGAEDVHWARKQEKDGKLGPKAREPSDLLNVGDVVLVKELTDPKTHKTRWSLRQVPQLEGGFMAMDVHTGRVIAMQGGFSYQSSAFNRATQALRQPGSGFKPFVYAAALDSGFTPATIVIDAPITVNTPQGLWTPKNAENSYYGPVPMRVGLEQSRNLMTIRIAQAIGMDTVAKYAQRFGVYDNMQPYLANSLGSEATTLYRLVTAYAEIANGGVKVDPTLVDRVQDRFGKTIYRHTTAVCTDCTNPNLPAGQAPEIVSNSERVIDPITDYQLISMMEGVVQRGTAAGVVNLPVPVAGKTGTTNFAKDVWFTGFTSNLVAGCYMGFDVPKTLGRTAFGSNMCGPVFQQFMLQAIKKYGGTAFKVPPGGHFINIDRWTGEPLPADATGKNVQPEYFRDGSDPVFGMAGMVDGGFAMGSNLPLVTQDQNGQGAGQPGTGQAGTTGTDGTGAGAGQPTVPGKANFGTVSSGGLY
ncbi:MAG: transglycosylase domain-containing protein, partial [Paracoccaceae bacterium]|nr:transglycosylase domain-containing protein [Paracoccaceae bacterium]